jgi:hypothetical protein
MSRLQRLRSAGWVLGLTLASLFTACSSATAQPVVQPFLVNPGVVQTFNVNRPFVAPGRVGVGMLPATIQVNTAAWAFWNRLAFERTWWANQQALIAPFVWNNIPDPLGPLALSPCMTTPWSPLAPTMVNPFAPGIPGVNPQPAPFIGRGYLFGATSPIGAFPSANGLALGLGAGLGGSPTALQLPGLGAGAANPAGLGGGAGVPGGLGGIGNGMNPNIGGLGGAGLGLNNAN